MRRFILKLVVPIVLLFSMVGIACYSYALILKSLLRRLKELLSAWSVMPREADMILRASR